MLKRKSFLVLFILAILGPIPATLSAAEQPELKPAPSVSAGKTAEAFSDRYIALSVAMGILGLAFFRKKPKSNHATQIDPINAPSRVEYILTQETPSIAKTSAVEPTNLELASKDNPIAKRPSGRNIVVPIDLSSNSELAIRLALVWAKPHDKLIVVYACDLENAFPSENLTPSNLNSLHQAFVNIDTEIAYHWSRLPWVMVVPEAMEIVQNWAQNEFELLRKKRRWV